VARVISAISETSALSFSVHEIRLAGRPARFANESVPSLTTESFDFRFANKRKFSAGAMFGVRRKLK
jgi:hypothetical protein